MRYVSHWKMIAAMMAISAGVVSWAPGALADVTSILAELQSKKFLSAFFAPHASDVRAALRQAGIGYKVIKPIPDGITGELSEADAAEQARVVLNRLTQSGDHFFTLNLSDRQFSLTLPQATIAALVDEAAEQSVGVLRARLKDLGVTGASVQRQQGDRILIQIPDSANPELVSKAIGSTGKLTFQPACDEQPDDPVDRPPEGCAAYPVKGIPDQKMWIKTAITDIVDGRHVNDSSASIDPVMTEPIVAFRFNQKGAERFGKLTSENVGKAFAIVLDQVVISAPRIIDPILGGSGQISGQFTMEEAKSLALVLRSGALPAPIRYISMTTDSGADAGTKKQDP